VAVGHCGPHVRTGLCGLLIARCIVPLMYRHVTVPSDSQPIIPSLLKQRTSFLHLISADFIDIRAIRWPRREAECTPSIGAHVKNEWPYVSFPPHQFLSRRTTAASAEGKTRVRYDVLRGCARCSVDPGHCNSRGRDHTGVSGQLTLFTWCAG